MIKLPCFGITIELGPEDPDHPGAYMGAKLISGLERFDACKDPEDYEYNGALDGIESMILAHACAGIDVASPAYVEGIERAVECCADNLL